MRRIIVAVIISMVIMPVFPAVGIVSQENTAVIPIDFINNDYDIRMGFSTKPITKLTPPNAADGIIADGRIQFMPNAAADLFDTGIFYFYAQIFTQTEIQIRITSAPPLTKEEAAESISWTNVGLTANGTDGTDPFRASFTEESEKQDFVIYSEAGTNQLYPRVANMEFDFQIPFSNIPSTIPSGEYRGSMTIEVTSI